MTTKRKPIVLAPMAGGPSTPELCAAVTNAGGLGFLAGGYLSPEKFEEQVRAVESMTDRDFGVNLFYLASPQSGQEEAYSDYRCRLVAECSVYSEFPSEPQWSDDNYDLKLEIALRSQAKFISFTFGYPDESTIGRVHQAGKKLVLNATTPREIDYINALDCDVILLQGKSAGGHRASVLGGSSAEGYSYDVRDLLRYGIASTDKPIFAGGGVGTAEDVLNLLREGATAVVVGTRFLTAEEAGTKETHQRALLEFTDRDTVITHAFSGKPARAISNTFTEKFTDHAPHIYPELHYLTAGMRAESNKQHNPEYLNLWAGEGFTHCRKAPAAHIIDELLSCSQLQDANDT